MIRNIMGTRKQWYRWGDMPDSKRLKLELSIDFEEGRGVLRDLGNAERLYRSAANDSGRIVPLNRGPMTPGLVAASRRPAALRASRTSRSGASERRR